MKNIYTSCPISILQKIGVRGIVYKEVSIG